MDVPEFSGRNEEAAVGYVRPHDIHLEKVNTSADAVSATVSHIHVIGPIVQIELKREDAEEFLEAELSKEHYKTLSLQVGDQVYVKPKQLKVFIPEDYSI